MSSKLRILVLISYYIPGYKSGGPLRTVSNMVQDLGDEFDFYIITLDRDSLDMVPYSNIEVGQWQTVGKAKVCYLSPDDFNIKGLYNYIKSAQYDIVYLNSYFAWLTINYLILRKAGLLPKTPFIIAPRGEFSPGAVSLKFTKKRLYIALAKLVQLYKTALWQASNSEEKKQITNIYPDSEIFIAPDLTSSPLQKIEAKARQKEPGSVKIVFLSRISPKKNLLLALQLLSSVKGLVQFDIVGLAQDIDYWRRCQIIIQQLPPHIQVNYLGTTPHEEVISTLQGYHLFLLPTLGENFGHVIVEALIAGCLILISDQTPWHGLREKNIGWDLPLDKLDEFQKVLQETIDMNDAEFQARSEAAKIFISQYVQDENILDANRKLFLKFSKEL